MGRSYYVPRSAKGESRILYIFTIKSFATTIAFGIIGFVIYLFLKNFMEMSLITMILIIAPFAGIGYVVGALQIPDTPMLGKLQKAGGENVSDILLRLLAFKNKKKLYIYGLDRKIDNSKYAKKSKMNIIKKKGAL